MDFNFHNLPAGELAELYSKHPLFEDIKAICADMRWSEAQVKKYDIHWGGVKKLVVPFKFMKKTVTEEQLHEIFNCRITSNMT